MAEIAVGYVVDLLIPLLTQEASLLRQGHVHSQVLDIKRELKSIQCFLKDADRRSETIHGEITTTTSSRDDGGVKEWVEQLREVAFQIEDAIDEYLLHLAPNHRQHGLFLSSIHRVGHSILNLKARHHIASQIGRISATIREIKERSLRYGFYFSTLVNDDDDLHHRGCKSGFGPKPTWYDPRNATIFLEEAEIVGIESDTERLISWLEDKSPPERTVVSVVGMGGMGKTTLAKRVYDRVVAKFDCHAWITVSESYGKKELLVKMMEQFGQTTMMGSNPETNGGDGIDEEIGMIRKIREFLKSKRYVVFFDDVWKVEFWSDIEHALFDNKIGGRIVITTRSMDVANFCKKSSFVHTHMLQPLPLDKAWQLFCNKAFQFEFGGYCPPELVNLSGKIVKRCKGLPLAIVAIAGLLSTKEKTVAEWQKLHDNLSSELESNPHLTSITRILSLSYNDLPYYLKSCFLYLGMYPEDYTINCSRLIRQWISEGFIAPNKDKALEVVAQEYLTMLINRSLVQVTKVSFSGNAKECCIHDLMREMILRKMKDLHFGHFSQYESNLTEVTRRLSIGKSSYNVLSGIKNSCVRAILIFNRYEIPDFTKTAFSSNFKLLKVLDFEGALDLAHLPKGIGNLFHLKYLSVAHTNVQVLPRSIGKLQNLEILNLKYSLVNDLPVGINGLYKLKHLLAFRGHTKTSYCFPSYEGLKLQKGFGCLAALQKLYNVDGFVIELDELRKLTQLRKLGILNLRAKDGNSMCRCINEMKHLESLRVSSVSADENIDLDSLSYPPESLRCLYIKGPLRKLPEWITKLHNLAKLEIEWSRLKDDPLNVLCNLQNLVMLKITNYAYTGKELCFKKGMFPKLKYLHLQSLLELNLMVIEEGAMPSLEQLIIENCRQLKKVPFGLQHLRNLKKPLIS